VLVFLAVHPTKSNGGSIRKYQEVSKVSKYHFSGTHNKF
jgi:hypothetical protein